MRQSWCTLSLLLILISLPVGLYAKYNSQKNTEDEESQKIIRVFLNSGDILDINTSEIDSITTTSDTQKIWHDETYQSIAIESIDSVWYISPVLRLTTQCLDFGKVAVGNSKTSCVTITNTGDYPETYYLLADGIFHTYGSGDGHIINAGQSLNIDLTFSPTDATNYTGNLLVASSAVGKGIMKMPLMGTGVEAVNMEENANLPPMEQDFDIVMPEEESLDAFDNFKIVNFYGEYPLTLPSEAKGMRKIRRAGAVNNVFSSSAIVSSEGLQAHSVVDTQGNPYFFSISLPDEKPEISFRETAISLLLAHPDLTPKNQTEYRNAVKIITKLESFPAFVQQVASAYYEGRKKNQCPDYSNLNATPIFTELYEATKDNSYLTYGGVSLKNLKVTPVSAKFRLHNDLKRFILAYPSRVKMADNNLIVVDREDALPLVDMLNELLDKAFDHVESKLDSHLPDLDSEDKEFIEDLKNWIHEIEEEEIAQNPAMNEVFQFAMPYILNSSNADYWTIVWDYYLDDLVYGFEHEESIFDKESDDIEIEYKGYDKIFLDIYGLGLLREKSWDDFSETDKSRIMIACLWGAYHDVIEPCWKMITNGIAAYKATKGYKFDFRYGAQKYPECALVAKLYQNFKKKKENVLKLAQNADNGDIKAILKQFGIFALDQLLTIPKESDNIEDKRTYLNLIYNIWKKYTNTTTTAEAFRKQWKDTANRYLSKYNLVMKTISASEAGVNFVGGVNALLQSDLKKTIVIDKYKETYIEVIEPLYTPSDLNQTIQFKWQTYKGNTYGKLLYDLIFAAETPDNFNQFTVMSNIDGTSCEIDLSKITELRNADRVLFRIVAHDDKSDMPYAKTDFRTLMSKLKDNVPEFLDLGLPSGTLWAVCNLGATQSVDFGDYYAWGETDTKTSFSWKNYKYSKGTSNSLTKYCTKSSYGNNGFTDDLDELQGSDDPLSRQYGYYYSIPTKEDWEELMTYCNWTWFADGAKVKGPSGDVLYLPAAGYRSGLNQYDVQSAGYYWSSTLDPNSPDDAWFLYFSKGKPSSYDYYRYYGRSIRPVMHKTPTSPPLKRAASSKVWAPLENNFDGIEVMGLSRSSIKE